MTGAGRDPGAKIDLLKSLAGRVRPASELIARTPPAATPPASPVSGVSPRTPARSSPPAPALNELLPHAWRQETDEGSVMRLRNDAPLTGALTREGYSCPAPELSRETLTRDLAILARDPAWLDADPERIAFIDTETTGLSGGSGTSVFLIGIGRFSAGRFVVDQYFMESFGDEAALVRVVDEELSRAQAVVTYNGGSFDLPLMRTRWLMQRRPPRFPRLHLDLLHPVRRIWRARLPDCSLGTVEREILGVRRTSDVESRLIPQIWFDYERGVRRDRIIPVIDHHAQDIFSLGALLHTLASGIAAPGSPQFDRATDQWGLAGILSRAGRHEDAVARLERAVALAGDDDFGFRASMHLARRLVRLGRAAEALAIWREHSARARPGRLDPLIELAKHMEHRERDPHEARRMTLRALAVLRADEELSQAVGGVKARSAHADEIDALEHRLRRLTRKIGDGAR